MMHVYKKHRYGSLYMYTEMHVYMSLYMIAKDAHNVFCIHHIKHAVSLSLLLSYVLVLTLSTIDTTTAKK